MIGDQGEGVAEEIGTEMVGSPYQRQTFIVEGGVVLLGRVARPWCVADWMLHAFFIKLTQHRSHPLVALVRCEDKRLVYVWQLQHGRLAKVQLELLKCLAASFFNSWLRGWAMELKCSTNFR